MREYIQRFNKLALEVPSATSEILVNTFSQELMEDDFFCSLAKKPLVIYDDLMRTVEKYINMEEVQWVKKLEPNFLHRRTN